MKNTRRTISLLLVLCMLAAYIPASVIPASAAGEDLTIDFNYAQKAKSAQDALRLEGAAKENTIKNVSENYYQSNQNKFQWKHLAGDALTVEQSNEGTLRKLMESTDSKDKYISLQEDCDYAYHKDTVWKTIEITTDKVLDLNGHSLSMRYDSNRKNDSTAQTTHAVYHKAIMFEIKQGATLTIIDSSRWRGVNGGKGSGKIKFTGYMVDPYSYDINFYTTRDLFWVNGNLVIYGGTYQAGRQKDQLKNNFSWSKLKTVIGSAVELGVSVAEYATGIDAASAALKDLNESYLTENITSGDNNGKDDLSTSTVKAEGTGGVKENKKDTPDSKANSDIGEGRNETISEKNDSKKKTDNNTANDKSTGKNDKNTKIAEAEKKVVDSVVNKSKIGSMVDGAFSFVEGIVGMIGKDERSRVTQSIQGTVAHVGNTGTLVVYDGEFKGYGSTPNTRNAVIEVTKQDTISPYNSNKYSGGQVYIYGGTFSGYTGANIFNMVRANANQTSVQFEKGTNGKMVQKTVTLSEQETMGFEQLFFDNAAAFAANPTGVTPVPVSTKNVVVKGGVFRNYYEIMNVAPKTDEGHFNKFPGTAGSVNLGIESFGEDLIRDGRIQIVDKYGDGALVLMDEDKKGGINHHRLFCGDTELRYKQYLEVYPNYSDANASYSFQLETYYGQDSQHLLSKAWGSDSENVREAPFANTEKFITFPIDARNSESYYFTPHLTDTDVYGKNLLASDVWYYNTPTDYRGQPIADLAWGDVRMEASGKQNTSLIIRSSQQTNTQSQWKNNLEKADRSSVEYTAYSYDSYQTNMKWFTYRIYRVDPLTRESISESSAYGVDEPLATVVYGVSSDSLKCKLPLMEMERQIKRRRSNWEGYQPGEMYRVILDIEEYLAFDYTNSGNYMTKLPAAKTQTSLCFRCVSVEEQTSGGTTGNIPDFTALQWSSQPEIGKTASVHLMDAKAGLVDYNSNKIFDVYYQWWEVDAKGKPIKLLAGTDNIYDKNNTGDKAWHVPEYWNVGNDGFTYANTKTLPADKKEWKATDIHMYTYEMCNDDPRMKLRSKENLSPSNNNTAYSSTDNCYIPESLSGKTIRVKAIVVNLKWQKNFDKKQVFWSHSVTLPEVIKPLKGELNIAYQSGYNYAASNRPATFSVKNIGGLASDEYITEVKYIVGTKDVTLNGLHATSAAQLPTAKFPQDFYGGKALPAFDSRAVWAYYKTNKGRSINTSVDYISFAIEATGIRRISSSDTVEYKLQDVKNGKYVNGLRSFVPVPIDASIGYSFDNAVSTNPAVAYLDNSGFMKFGGSSGSSTLSVKGPDGKTVSLTVRVINEYHHIEVSGLQAPTLGKTFPCSAKVPKDAPYHVKEVYWSYGDTAISASATAENYHVYTVNVVVESNDCCRVDSRIPNTTMNYNNADGTTSSSEASRIKFDDGIVTLSHTFTSISGGAREKIDQIFIDYPTEVDEGTNVSDWLEDVQVSTNGDDSWLNINLRPTYSPDARNIVDTYADVYSLNSDGFCEINTFIPGVQSGLFVDIEIPSELAASFDTKNLVVTANGKTIKPGVWSDHLILCEDYDTLTIKQAEPAPVVPDYEVKNYDLILGKPVMVSDLLVCDDPRVTLEFSGARIDFSEELSDYFAYDAEEDAFTILRDFPDRLAVMYITLMVKFDANGDGTPEYMRKYVTGVGGSESDYYYDKMVYLNAADAPGYPEVKLPEHEETLLSGVDFQAYTGTQDVYAYIRNADGTTSNVELSIDGERFIHSDHLGGLEPNTEYLLFYRNDRFSPVYTKVIHTANLDYGVWVGRSPVTDSNLGNLERDGWHYDPAIKTLTLKNLDLTDLGLVCENLDILGYSLGQRALIGSMSDLTVVLLGDNKVEHSKCGEIYSVFYSAGELTISGSGNLSASLNCLGGSIFDSIGDITIDCSGTLSLTNYYATVFDTSEGTINYRNGTIDYISDTITAEGQKYQMGYFIYSSDAGKLNFSDKVHSIAISIAGGDDVYTKVDEAGLISNLSAESPKQSVRIAPNHSDIKQVASEEFLKSGSCDQGAEYYYSCSCGHIGTATFTTPVCAHDLTVRFASPATCNYEGWDEYTVCNKCGYTDFEEHYHEPLGHNWGPWETIKEATPDEDGLLQRICSNDPTHIQYKVVLSTLPSTLTPLPQDNPFIDVDESAYYYTPVIWAVNHEPQITNGKAEGIFSPDDTCTRAQVVTFLWRAFGCPEPKSKVNPFNDVNSSDYYYKAVLWAVEKGITNGTSAAAFSPNRGCTRAQVVTFLWRAEGEPNPGSLDNPFSDVSSSDYYYKAVLWAVARGITNGTSTTAFSPNRTCTRGQIVTFLYRDMTQ